jgi:hypothetical protein
MTKVLLSCSCGADVMYDYMYEPVYDEGEVLISHTTTVVFNDKCEDCHHKAHLDQLPFMKDEDELPF